MSTLEVAVVSNSRYLFLVFFSQFYYDYLCTNNTYKYFNETTLEAKTKAKLLDLRDGV